MMVRQFIHTHVKKAAPAVAAALFLGVSGAYAAWSNPTAAPTGGNTAAPINVGSTFQEKEGDFWAGAIGTDSGYCIGADCITAWPTSSSSLWDAVTGGINYAGGNVGIGASSPSTKLHVAGGARVTGLVSCDTIDTDAAGNLTCGTDDGGAASGWVDDGTAVRLETSTDDVGIGLAAPSTPLEVQGIASADQLSIWGGPSYFGGSVGINDASPSYALDVTGDIRANNGWIRSTGDYGLYNNSDGTYFYSDDANYFRMRSDRGMRVTNRAGTLQGFLYHDNALNFGLLNSTGSWRVRANSAGVNLYGTIGMPSLANCDTIDTDANGNLSCGTDDSGAVLNGWSFADDNLFDDSENVIEASDEWLRLNQGGDFANGVYTPGNLRTDGSLFIGSDAIFYRDTANRIRTPDMLYVDANSPATYLYSTNTYLGAASGDSIHMRGNTLDGDSFFLNAASGGMHVGGTSDPGTDNLAVDGDVTVGGGAQVADLVSCQVVTTDSSGNLSCGTVSESSCTYGSVSDWSACDAPGYPAGGCDISFGVEKRTRTLTCGGVSTQTVYDVRICSINNAPYCP